MQVLTNLISNAIKFCEPSKGRVHIAYGVKDNFIEVYVRDNGKVYKRLLFWGSVKYQ